MSEQPGKSWYIHTIDGRPAFYSARNRQIVYAMRRQHVSILVPDLATIRRERAATVAWRAKQGFTDRYGKYGYICFARKSR